MIIKLYCQQRITSNKCIQYWWNMADNESDLIRKIVLLVLCSVTNVENLDIKRRCARVRNMRYVPNVLEIASENWKLPNPSYNYPGFSKQYAIAHFIDYRKNLFVIRNISSLNNARKSLREFQIQMEPYSLKDFYGYSCSVRPWR